jgi:hypothetical protein
MRKESVRIADITLLLLLACTIHLLLCPMDIITPTQECILTHKYIIASYTCTYNFMHIVKKILVLNGPNSLASHTEDVVKRKNKIKWWKGREGEKRRRKK